MSSDKNLFHKYRNHCYAYSSYQVCGMTCILACCNLYFRILFFWDFFSHCFLGVSLNFLPFVIINKIYSFCDHCRSIWVLARLWYFRYPKILKDLFVCPLWGFCENMDNIFFTYWTSYHPKDMDHCSLLINIL